MIEIYKKELQKRLSRLPLDRKLRVGVYGAGEHTANLIKWYSELIGEIKADVFLIDSYKRSGTKNDLGRDVYHIDDLELAAPDAIIVSSKLYEREMYNNIAIRYGHKYPIYLLYENGEKITELLLNNGYKIAYKNPTNGIFVDSRLKIKWG